jgi:hypothetical protein
MRHEQKLKSNQRMQMQLRNLRRLGKKEQTLISRQATKTKKDNT